MMVYKKKKSISKITRFPVKVTTRFFDSFPLAGGLGASGRAAILVLSVRQRKVSGEVGRAVIVKA